MATIAELIGANPEQVQELLDTARAAEEAKRAAKLAEEAAKGQKALEASKMIASEPAEFSSRKAQALSKQAKAAMGEVGERVISDLPQVSGKMGSAMERAARSAAGTVGEGVIEASGPKHSIISRLANFAEKFGPSALERLGLSSGSIQALSKMATPAIKVGSKLAIPLAVATEVASTPSAGEGSDVTTGKQLTSQEMNYLGNKGTPVAPFVESDEKTLKEAPKQVASSAYDSLEQIKSDVQKQPLNVSYLKAISDELQKKDAYLNQLKNRSDLVPEEKARLWDTYVAQNQDKRMEERALEKSREVEAETSDLKNQISNLQNRINSETNPFLKDSLAKTLAQKTQQLDSLQGFGEEQKRIVAAPQQEQSEFVQELMSQPVTPMPQQAAVGQPQSPEAESLKPTKRAISAGEPSAIDVQKRDREESLSKIIGSEAAKQVAEQESLLARFKEAQERQRMAQLGISLGQAGERIGSALAMVKPGDQSFYEQQMKLAGGISEQVKDEEAVRQEAEKNDPNSPLSKQYQEIVKSMGIPLTGKESAATLTRALPFLQQYQTQKENREARREQAVLEREKIAATKALLLNEAANKEFTKMSEKLTSEIASSRSAFGKGANIVRSAEAIEKLVEGIDPKDIDVRQITEIARNLDAMLSQGAATISGTKKLIPSSFAGDAAKIAEYITSQPKGARQGEFVKRMIETVEREKELAKQQIVRTQNKILSGYGHLKEKYPERYNQILQEHDIPTDGSTRETQSLKKAQVTLPEKSAARLKPGQTFQLKSSGKTYRVNADGKTATEL